MEVVSKESFSRGAILSPWQPKNRLSFYPRSESMVSAMDRYASEEWAFRDERYKAAAKVLADGVATDLDFTDHDGIRKSEYYQDFVEREGYKWFAAVRVPGEEGWIIAVQRSAAQAHFEPHELVQLKQMGQQLSSAAAMIRTLAFAKADAALGAFDVSDVAALMLNGVGEVIKFNARAETLMCPDVFVSNRRLRSRSVAVSNALDRAISELIWKPDLPQPGPVAMPREFARPIIAYVLRADRIMRDALAPARAFVLLTDPDSDSAPAVSDLMAIFSLTRAEARLVIELKRTSDLRDAARAVNITYESARTTLKQVLKKTDTNSQVSLMVLISRLLSF